MTIIGGFDVHRKQITFDYVDTDTGEVRTVRSVRRPGKRCGPGLGEHCSGGEAEFAVEGCAAVCETAAQLGMPVAVHTGAAEGCKQAIRCGVRSLEHGYLINDEALEMAENAGVLLVPTMQAIREDRAGLAKGTLADYTAAKFPRDAEQISIPTA